MGEIIVLTVGSNSILGVLRMGSYVENGLEDTGAGEGKLGKSERVAWTYIHYQM